MASRRGLEPLTPGLGNLCSIQLSYRDSNHRAAAKTLWTGQGQARHALSMNFRFAHRSRASFADARRRLRGAGVALAAIVFASPCLAACGRPAGRVEAVGVDERLDIELSDGRIVRLGGLDAPNAERGSPETANSAREVSERPAPRAVRRPYPIGRRFRSLGQDRRRSRRRRSAGGVRRLDRGGAAHGRLRPGAARIRDSGWRSKRKHAKSKREYGAIRNSP